MSPISSLNFSGQKLQGRSFRGQDLTGADFSSADIRGADFTNTTLTDANFRQALAGLSPIHRFLLTGTTFLLSGLSGLIATLATLFTGYLLFPYSIRSPYLLAPLAVLGLGGTLAITIIRFPLGKAFGISIGAGIVCGGLLGSMTGTLDGIAAGAIAITTTTLISLSVIVILAMLLIATRVLAGRIATLLTVVMMVLGSAMGAKIGINITFAAAKVMAVEGLTVMKIAAMEEGVMAAMLGCSAAACLSGYVSWRASHGDRRFQGIWQGAIAFTHLGGTRFRGANLTNTNFRQATLKNADFRQANLTRTNFHQARQLHQAMVHQTILADSEVRELVVTHQGQNKSYAGRNLKGADLTCADLRGANLIAANISEANLTGAQLTQANLTQVQALGTHFQQAVLTGACIEAWNIDSTTQLEAVACEYIYLHQTQQERRPSSGNFAPGDFTGLFEEILDTMDLIFRNGIDHNAFHYALNQLQVENAGIEMTVRSLEKKSNGVVVVRVDLPDGQDKTVLHAEFSESYELAMQAIAANHQNQLKAKDDQIALYQQQQGDWQAVMQLLKNQPNFRSIKTPEKKRVVLHIGEGSPTIGFSVTLHIEADQQSRSMQFTKGCLPSLTDLLGLYDQWQMAYRQCLQSSFRLEIPDTQITNVSRQPLFQECSGIATKLEQQLNDWLNSASFRPIKERMLEQLAPTEMIEIIVETDDPQLRRLPFQLWDFLHRYPQAEMALSLPDYEGVEPLVMADSALVMKILAIFGDGTGLDLRSDRTTLSQLPNAEVTYLVEPQRQDLNQQLWQQSWDILFFAGHSFSQPNCDQGFLQINGQNRLSIAELRHGLRKAISQGLKLAIFNSCDGLGLAKELADLHIPYMIVMREPVPDYVAQAFLKSFLAGFSTGKSLHQAVREAREQLQGLEDRFPCATWLPIICQNPTTEPLIWPGVRS